MWCVAWIPAPRRPEELESRELRVLGCKWGGSWCLSPTVERTSVLTYLVSFVTWTWTWTWKGCFETLVLNISRYSCMCMYVHTRVPFLRCSEDVNWHAPLVRSQNTANPQLFTSPKATPTSHVPSKALCSRLRNRLQETNFMNFWHDAFVAKKVRHYLPVESNTIYFTHKTHKPQIFDYLNSMLPGCKTSNNKVASHGWKPGLRFGKWACCGTELELAVEQTGGKL